MSALAVNFVVFTLLSSSGIDDHRPAGSSELKRSSLLVASRARQSMYWTWDDGREHARSRIDTDDLSFPANFLWGTASAAHQVEGGCSNNNWARWEEGVDSKTGLPRERAGSACEHWVRFREDIQLMKALGMTAHRFSVEWSKIEPSPGVFDAEAIAHYHEVLDALHEAGIQPMITLFHFTIPKWFEELGGFEVESNAGYFVAFCQRVFAEFSPKCALWCTINEPEIYVEGGYGSGKFPPCRRDVKLAAVVLRNLLEAHVQVYQALKAMPGGPAAQIGIVKNIFQFEPWDRLSPLDRLAAWLVDESMNESVLRFLRTGLFRFWLPGQVRLSRTNTRAPASYDFLGLNYYSHYHVRFIPTLGALSAGGSSQFELLHLPREEALMSDLGYPLYPEGFYRALVRVGRLGKPVIVTESGVADARDDRRALHLRRYLYALSAAIADGVDVRGYFHWTLTDNFEWAEGYAAKFGLYANDRQTQQRTLRPSAEVYRRVVARFSKRPPSVGGSPSGIQAPLAAAEAGSPRMPPSGELPVGAHPQSEQAAWSQPAAESEPLEEPRRQPLGGMAAAAQDLEVSLASAPRIAAPPGTDMIGDAQVDLPSPTSKEASPHDDQSVTE